ncbi:MAG TPA: DoxX family protein [Candidatus Nanoarchaeia archaeon]|nr:DoxX family protein [Candidatus Nanoarchaeia archaeon]
MFENLKRYAEYGPLLLRLGIAMSFLLHGIPKLMNFSATAGFFSSLGFPGFFGPIVGIFEVAGGILMFIGLWTRLAALWLAIIMTVALLFVHIPRMLGADFFPDFGTIELPLLLLLMNLALLFRGAGKLAVDSA